ncbi:glycosyltransferase family 39 protein [Candidatus Binatus sp.]|uniref:glycosyltransferase family 39 protein n=1 Tax=Candidatus Binatus sp. TaxID=2811406 RepID=UPI003C829CBE
MSRAKSSKAPAVAEAHYSGALSKVEAVIVGAIVLLFNVMVQCSGFRRGVELMPWPDGLEYAASAVNLARGRGAVLHFGGYTYPSRYTAGYPLILEFFCRSNNGHFLQLAFLSTIIATVSIFSIFILARHLFGRSAAAIAALVLALSPVFITYSLLVMSDVPTLFVTICAASMLVVAASDYAGQLQSARLAAWLMFGLFAGFSTIMRPTNATILVGLGLCVVMVPFEKRELSSLIKAGVAAAIGFAIPVAWQLHQNAINLGSPFASGYAWWVPEVYGAGGRTFSIAYLFGPTMPRNPHGNVIVYLTTLLGLDGMLGDRGDARYFLYPFPAAVFAIVGFIAIFRSGTSGARRLMWFGLGYLGALTALYCFYLFTDVAFILPGAFILFLAAGAGAALANRWMRDAIRDRSRSNRQLAGVASVIVLDVLLIVSLTTEAVARLSAPPQSSLMVESLQSIDASLPRDATIISNISLQFLDLYLGESRSYVGLNSMDPGERFTDYHLHRLYEKRAAGWTGPLPAVAFDGDQMSAAEADSLASTLEAKTPVLLLIAAPESQQYADVLKSEFDQLQAKFTIDPVSQNEAVALYRLSARK